MGHTSGLWSGSDSDLSDAPPSPRQTPAPLSGPSSNKTGISPQQAPARSLPPFKSQHSQPLRPTKRQPSISHPQPPSSPKRRKQGTKAASPAPPQPLADARQTNARRVAKRPTYAEDSSEESDSDEPVEDKSKPKRRRKSRVLPKATTQTSSADPTAFKPTPKRSRPRASTAAQPSSLPKHQKKTSQPLDLRPASFLTNSKPSFFSQIAPAPSTSSGAGLQPRADIWSYVELSGLVWVRLNVPAGTIHSEDKGDAGCWWPAEIAEKTSTQMKLTPCTTAITLNIEASILNKSNILTFRQPNSSSVRFPTFKSAYSPPSPPPDTSTDNIPTTEAPISSPTSNTNPLPTDPIVLETNWKASLTRAFEIDTESNDGLEDILLLFSQKSKSTKDDATTGSEETALDEEDDGEKTDEGDVLEEGTAVLCRYRTRYYPAQVVSYYPREGKHRRGRYQCRFADDSTRVAGRNEIFTTLEEQFATCPLGSYQRYAINNAASHGLPPHKAARAPTPEPRAASPPPESSDTKIDCTEYCGRERMRDQLRPVLPFLQGIIERTYAPAQGQGREEVLDRHAVFMQGGRARQNLAYSVHTGDLNEDDCEELMFEVSRWALRGERWASGVSDADANTNASDRIREGEQAAQKAQEQGEQVNEKGKEVVGEVPKGQEGQEAGGASQATTNEQDIEMKDAGEDEWASARAKEVSKSSTPEPNSEATTELEDNLEAQHVGHAARDKDTDTSLSNAFHRLVQLQPPRPVGSADYEGLTPQERMGYASDVLYPEAAAFVLSYRRGIRTHAGPLPDPTVEYDLYKAGLQAAKDSTSNEGWVDQILAVRQLREMNAKRHCADEETQVLVSGGTRSRPKFMLSKTSSMLK